jgi:hypothetical protein
MDNMLHQEPFLNDKINFVKIKIKFFFFILLQYFYIKKIYNKKMKLKKNLNNIKKQMSITPKQEIKRTPHENKK